MPGILEKTHPFCQTNAIINEFQKVVLIRLIYYNGRTMQRNFIDY